MRNAALALTVCLLLPAAHLFAQQDSTRAAAPSAEHFSAKQAVVPALLITAGMAGINGEWMPEINEWGSHWAFSADDYLRFVPAAGFLGLEYLGAKAKHPLRERLAAGVTAFAVMSVATYGLKGLVSEQRPGGENHRSFPSGHTSFAFLGAELVRSEYGGAYGWAAYGIATGTALLRMANNKHWVNDVLAGAGIGILSAKVGMWLLPWERRLLGWDKNKKGNLAVVPFYEPTTKGFGGALAITL